MQRGSAFSKKFRKVRSFKMPYKSTVYSNSRLASLATLHFSHYSSLFINIAFLSLLIQPSACSGLFSMAWSYLAYFDKLFSNNLLHLDLAILVSRVALNLLFASLTTTERSLPFRYFAFILHIWMSWIPKILLWTPGVRESPVGNQCYRW